MTDLLARLEAAEAGSSWTTHDAIAFADLLVARGPGWQDVASLALSALGGSIDAAKALIERVLPGCSWMVRHYAIGKGGPSFCAYVREPFFDLVDSGPVNSTPALAMCIALLRAVEAKGE